MNSSVTADVGARSLVFFLRVAGSPPAFTFSHLSSFRIKRHISDLRNCGPSKQNLFFKAGLPSALSRAGCARAGYRPPPNSRLRRRLRVTAFSRVKSLFHRVCVALSSPVGHPIASVRGVCEAGIHQRAAKVPNKAHAFYTTFQKVLKGLMVEEDKYRKDRHNRRERARKRGREGEGEAVNSGIRRTYVEATRTLVIRGEGCVGRGCLLS